MVWIDCGILRYIVSILRKVQVAQPTVLNTAKTFQAKEANPTQYLKCDLIQIISNICFECEKGQNEIRDEDGIPLVLQNCTVDDLNPCKQFI